MSTRVMLFVLAFLAACGGAPAWHTGPAAPFEAGARQRVWIPAGGSWTGAFTAHAGEWVVVRIDGNLPIRFSAFMSNVDQAGGLKNPAVGHVLKDGEVRVHVRANQDFYAGTVDVNVTVLPPMDLDRQRAISRAREGQSPIDWGVDEPPYAVDDEATIVARLEEDNRDVSTDVPRAPPEDQPDLWPQARQDFVNGITGAGMDLLYDAGHELDASSLGIGRFDVKAKQHLSISVTTREDTPIRLKLATGKGAEQDFELPLRANVGPFFSRTGSVVLDQDDHVDLAVATYGDFTDAWVFVTRERTP